MFRKNHHFNPQKVHHTRRGFRNHEPFAITLRAVQKWEFERIKAGMPFKPAAGYEAFYAQWRQDADFSVLPDNNFWWLGHATTLVRMNGLNVLTDPIFSDRASPFRFAGPKRCMPAPVGIEGLPHIDVILISHSHYDHLDYRSIQSLLKRFPDVMVLVPLGLKHIMHSWGAKHVSEMDWWDRKQVQGVNFHCTPARHWSKRQIVGRNDTLWCGWLMDSGDAQEKRYYFMGDTSYSTLLHEVVQRLGPVDLAAIPIGCYSPRWFMKEQHIDPEQAVQLFRELGCKRAVAVHWGTFELSSEALDEPPKLLEQARKDQGVSPDLFQLIKTGAQQLF